MQAVRTCSTHRKRGRHRVYLCGALRSDCVRSHGPMICLERHLHLRLHLHLSLHLHLNTYLSLYLLWMRGCALVPSPHYHQPARAQAARSGHILAGRLPEPHVHLGKARQQDAKCLRTLAVDMGRFGHGSTQLLLPGDA